jgi:Bacterial PH domain
MKKVYKSGISYWLLSLVLLVLSTVSVLLYLDGVPWIALLLILALFIFILQLFVNTNYVIDKEMLKIRAGFLYKLDLNIQQIIRIEETSSPLSSPAASFDRLEIIYNKFDSVIISPKEKKLFIQDILQINPTIEIKYRK